MAMSVPQGLVVILGRIKYRCDAAVVAGRTALVTKMLRRDCTLSVVESHGLKKPGDASQWLY